MSGSGAVSGPYLPRTPEDPVSVSGFGRTGHLSGRSGEAGQFIGFGTAPAWWAP